MDTAIEKAFLVHGIKQGAMKIVRSPAGLHYFDKSSRRNGKIVMIQTVANNKSSYNKKEPQGAEKARNLYETIGRPGFKSFMDLLERNLIHNCPVTKQDAMNAWSIYGPDEGAIMGKSCRSTPKKVDTSYIYNPPNTFMEQYKNVSICIDIIFFDGITFFVSISRKIQFYTIEKIEKRNNNRLLKCMKKILASYSNRGCKVKYILGDGEFRHMNEQVICRSYNAT